MITFFFFWGGGSVFVLFFGRRVVESTTVGWFTVQTAIQRKKLTLMDKNIKLKKKILRRVSVLLCARVDMRLEPGRKPSNPGADVNPPGGHKGIHICISIGIIRLDL